NYPGFPFIFAGTLVLLLVPIYFINKNIKPRAKAAAGAFIGFMVVCFMVSTLDVVLHGFQFPNWLNFRYSFVMSFFLLMLSYEGYKNLGDIKTKHITSIALILVILIAITEKLGYGYIRPETGIWPAYALVVVFASIFSLSKGESKRKILLLILTVLVAAEMGFNAFFIFKGAHEEVYYSDRPSYRDYFDRLYPLVEYMEDHDDGFYRSETVIRRTVNDPMALGINGVSNSTSTLNASVISMLHKLGLASQEHWTRYKGTTPLTDSILGIKYVISESMPNNLYEQVYSENDLVLYENPDALPVAFPCSMEVSGLVLDSIDPFINQNALLSTMLGEQYTEYFKLVNIREIVFENITASQQDGYVAYAPVVPGLNAHIEYILEPVGDNEIFMYLHSPYPRKANIWLNREKYIDTFWDYSSHCIMPLGAHEGEETISLITTPIESDYYLSNNMFYYLDKPVYEEAIGRLSSDVNAVQRISETRLMINVNAGKDDILFTTIPYEKGWHIKVNGEKAQPIEILDSLMAVELNEGTNTVEMRFIPPGLVAGAIISMVSILLLVIFTRIFKRKEKHIEGDLEKPET
nr:YfhO family protein [Clostridia bacterium]